MKRYECKGQLSIFDLEDPQPKPCQYRFARYIGQKVVLHVTSGKVEGTIKEIEPYYTTVVDKNGQEWVGTPTTMSEYKGMTYDKPPVGSIVYFASSMTVYQAKVVSHYDKQSPRGYKVETAGGQRWFITKSYSNKDEAVQEVIKTWHGPFDYKPLPKPSYQWHRLSKNTPPEDPDKVIKVMYTYFKGKHTGECAATYENGKINFIGLPWDIGKVEPEAWKETDYTEKEYREKYGR